MELNFQGPYTFMDGDASVFKAPCASAEGIYLWTIRQRNDRSHLIHYVGETVALAKRHREHLVNILGLNYGIFDPEKAQNGSSELIWRGLWRDRTAEGPLRQIAAYKESTEIVVRYLAVLNIFFAEVVVEQSLRKHIEGSIGYYLRNSHPELKVLYPDDNRVGISRNKRHGELLISAPEKILGLDERIPY